MRKHFKWIRVALFGLTVSLMTAQAAEMAKGLNLSGSFEGGYAFSWQPTVGTGGTKESAFGVDNLSMKFTFDVSDKTKVFVHNQLAVGTSAVGAGTGIQAALNSAAYYSNATLTSTNGRLAFSNTAAYLQHKCADGLYTTIGNLPLPVGMETMGDRYDMHSYYYSQAFNVGDAYNWHYDPGLMFTVKDVFPGAFEFAIFDGRNNTATTGTVTSTPAAATRFHWKFESGDWSLTPVVSGYFGRWRGGPKDFGASVGMMYKMNAIWANLEWLYDSNQTDEGTDATKVKDWSLYFEPGIDLGMFHLSTKIDYNKNDNDLTGGSANDWNVGAVASKTWSDKYRIRLAYTHLNLSGNRGNHGNDIRLLFGTKW